jgi:hypothetical protein
VCSGAPAPEGTGIGILGWEGSARLDNFGLPGGENTMHVGFIHLRVVDRGFGKYAERAQVQILDAGGAFVPNATVYVEWTLPDNSVVSQSNITRAIGEAAFKVNGYQTGTFQLCVTNVVLAGFTYDPNQNVETCDTIAVP